MSEDLIITKQMVDDIALFKGLPGEDLDVICEYLKLVEFKAYDYVFREGEPYGSAYFLIEGAVQVLKQIKKYKKQKVLTEIRVPQMFGELALISKGCRSASVLSLEPLLVAELSCENFENLILFHPTLAANVMRRIANVISNRLRVSNTNYAHLCAELESSL